MKKKLSCLLLTLVLVIGALTGCMGSNTALVLNADGTCVYTVKYMYEKETFQTTLDEAKDKSPLFGGDFTRAEETVGDMTYYNLQPSAYLCERRRHENSSDRPDCLYQPHEGGVCEPFPVHHRVYRIHSIF